MGVRVGEFHMRTVEERGLDSPARRIDLLSDAFHQVSVDIAEDKPGALEVVLSGWRWSPLRERFAGQELREM